MVIFLHNLMYFISNLLLYNKLSWVTTDSKKESKKESNLGYSVPFGGEKNMLKLDYGDHSMT